LKFNTLGKNSGPCSSSDNCVCKGGSAPVAPGTYKLVKSGTLCNPVTTLAECSQAAASLGLSDVTATDDNQRNGVSYDPPYCYLEGNSLKFNTLGKNSGPCSSSDNCVCKIRGSTTVKPLTGQPTCLWGIEHKCSWCSNGKWYYNVVKQKDCQNKAVAAGRDHYTYKAIAQQCRIPLSNGGCIGSGSSIGSYGTTCDGNHYYAKLGCANSQTTTIAHTSDHIPSTAKTNVSATSLPIVLGGSNNVLNKKGGSGVVIAVVVCLTIILLAAGGVAAAFFFIRLRKSQRSERAFDDINDQSTMHAQEAQYIAEGEVVDVITEEENFSKFGNGLDENESSTTTRI